MVQQLECVAEVLTGSLGGPGPTGAAPPIDRAAPLGTAPSIDDIPPLEGHAADGAPPGLDSAIGPATAVDDESTVDHGTPDSKRGGGLIQFGSRGRRRLDPCPGGVSGEAPVS
jgi:hypothetical protein